MRRFLESLTLTDWLILLCGWMVLVGLELTKELTVFDRMRAALEDPAKPDTQVAPREQPAAKPLAALCPPPQDYSVAMLQFGPAQKLVVYETFDLAETSIAWLEYKDKFGKGSYFGAFAANADLDWAWTQGYGSALEARRAAIHLCQSPGRPCKIVAELLPQAVTPSDICAETSSQGQAETYREFRAKTGQTRAIARSRNGTSNWWFTDDLQQAALRALQECHDDSVRNEDGIDSPCEVVEAWEGDTKVPLSVLTYRTFHDTADAPVSQTP